MGIEFDYRELKGKIRSVFGTDEAFANAMGLTLSALSQKLNNTAGWKQHQIIKACELLEIPFEFIPVYFFTVKV